MAAANRGLPAGGAQPGRILVEQQGQYQELRGPIPAPDVLEAYGQVIPDLPKTIIAQWQSETQHRRSLEQDAQRSMINGASALQRMVLRGQLFGFVLGVLAIAAGVVIVWRVPNGFGALGGGATILAGLAALIWGPKKSAIGDAIAAGEHPPGKDGRVAGQVVKS